MEIRRNIPSQKPQVSKTTSDDEAYANREGVAKTSKVGMEKLEKLQIAPTKASDIERAVEESSKSKIDISAAGEKYPKVKIMSDSTNADKQKMQDELKSLEKELKDYLKQAKALMKENKADDYKKLFEKMNSKLTHTIEIMKQDHPGQTKIIDALKEWRTQITKQFMMAVPQQPQEVNQTIITE